MDLSPVGVRARSRIMWRIVPYMFLLFVIAYLDRVNLGYAQLQMKGDLSFSDDVLGFGAGIFFIGYFFLEIPGSILVEKWSARGWIARIMITWGIVAIAMGFVHTKNQFYVALGAAKRGFFPESLCTSAGFETKMASSRGSSGCNLISTLSGRLFGLGFHWLNMGLEVVVYR